MCKSTQTLPPNPEDYRHTCDGCDTGMSGYQCPMHLAAPDLLAALKSIACDAMALRWMTPAKRQKSGLADLIEKRANDAIAKAKAL